MGGLLGINDSWLRRKYAIKNCNTSIAGIYNVDMTTTDNLPKEAYNYGVLLVLNASFFCSQIFIPDNFTIDPYMYIRPISDNGAFFREWVKIPITIIT